MLDCYINKDACMLFVSESDGYEFMIVSLDNKQWHFEAQNSDVSKVVLLFCQVFGDCY